MEKGTAGEVFNIGNDDEITILEFAKIIQRLARSKSKIIFSQELPEDDPRQRKPDIKKAKKNLNWKPRISLEEGLLKTIKYFDELL